MGVWVAGPAPRRPQFLGKYQAKELRHGNKDLHEREIWNDDIERWTGGWTHKFCVSKEDRARGVGGGGGDDDGGKGQGTTGTQVITSSLATEVWADRWREDLSAGRNLIELDGIGLDDNFYEVVGPPPEANAPIKVGLGMTTSIRSLDGNFDEGRDDAGYQGGPGELEYEGEGDDDGKMCRDDGRERGDAQDLREIENVTFTTEKVEVDKVVASANEAKEISQMLKPLAHRPGRLDNDAQGAMASTKNDQILRLRGGASDTDSDDSSFIYIDIIAKNVQSIMAEDRLTLLLEEVETFSWDILLLTETWREEEEESFITENGNHFLGAGGSRGSIGVAIILHKRWARNVGKVTICNSRLMAAYVTIAEKYFCFIVPYMPHGGCSDELVEKVYKEMEQIHIKAGRQNASSIFGADWNAVVGTWREGDGILTTGAYGLGDRDER